MKPVTAAARSALAGAVRAGGKLLRLSIRAAGWFRRRKIVVFYVWPDFERKAEAIADLLRRRGFPAAVRSGDSRVQRVAISASRDLWIGFWNEYPTEYAPKNYIFYNAEQLSLPRWRDDPNWIHGLQNALEVWDYSDANESYLSRFGKQIRRVPFGYAPYYESSYRANTVGKGLVEDIDVLFVGSLTERRRAVVDQLRALGLTVHLVSRESPAHGAQLDELYARARIVLSIYQFADPGAQLADYARLDHLLANRRFVVQERPSSIGADPDLERVITTCPYDQLADTCVRMLTQPEERRKIAEVAYRWFKSERALDATLPYDAVRGYLERLT